MKNFKISYVIAVLVMVVCSGNSNAQQWGITANGVYSDPHHGVKMKSAPLPVSDTATTHDQISVELVGEVGEPTVSADSIRGQYDSAMYDYEYAARIRRFHGDMLWDYYDDYYTDMYWYTGDPYYMGCSIYWGMAWPYGWGLTWGWYPYGWYDYWGYGWAVTWAWYDDRPAPQGPAWGQRPRAVPHGEIHDDGTGRPSTSRPTNNSVSRRGGVDFVQRDRTSSATPATRTHYSTTPQGRHHAVSGSAYRKPQAVAQHRAAQTSSLMTTRRGDYGRGAANPAALGRNSASVQPGVRINGAGYDYGRSALTGNRESNISRGTNATTRTRDLLSGSNTRISSGSTGSRSFGGASSATRGTSSMGSRLSSGGFSHGSGPSHSMGHGSISIKR